MLHINLAPGELDPPRWWFLSDVLVAAVALIAVYGAADVYVNHQRDTVAATEADITAWREQVEALAPQLEAVDALAAATARLAARERVLRRLTSSPVLRFAPVIVLEHLHTLRPDGVWLSGVTFDQGAMQVHGGALDAVQIAEFLTALAATKAARLTTADQRSQVFFALTRLEESRVRAHVPPGLDELAGYPSFAIALEVGYRLPQSPDQPTAVAFAAEEASP